MTKTAQLKKMGFKQCKDGGFIGYKYVYRNYQSPIYPSGFTWEPGYTYVEQVINGNRRRTCGTGLHCGTLQYCKNHMDDKHHRLLKVKFYLRNNLVVIPLNGTGKIRMKRMSVVSEVK